MVFALVLAHGAQLFTLTGNGGWTLELQAFISFAALRSCSWAAAGSRSSQISSFCPAGAQTALCETAIFSASGALLILADG
jgi:hypothetical protein